MAKRTNKSKQVTTNVSMPASLRAEVDLQMRQGGFENVSEYFRHLVLEEKKSMALGRRVLAKMLDDGWRSPRRPMDEEWLAERQRRVRERAATTRRRAG